MGTRAASDCFYLQVLHIYYQSELEDRLIVERILHSCLVPYQLPNEVSTIHCFKSTHQELQDCEVIMTHGDLLR